MDDIEIRVLVTELKTELKSLTNKVDTGFADIKESIKSGTASLSDHIKEDKENHHSLGKEIEALKMDMVKFKERWIMIGSGISLVGAALIELIVHAFIK